MTCFYPALIEIPHSMCALFAVMVVVIPVPAPAKIRGGGWGQIKGEEGADKYAPKKNDMHNRR